MDLRIPPPTGRCRPRGRPRKNHQLGPTPQLLQKKHHNQCQWTTSQVPIATQSWWHLFYDHHLISKEDFHLSQDFATFRHWARIMTSSHRPWRSPLALTRTHRSSTWSEEDQAKMSGWWHRLIQEPTLTDLWSALNFLYDSPVPTNYQPDLYVALLHDGRQGLKKIATHWVSRYDFLHLRYEIMIS